MKKKILCFALTIIIVLTVLCIIDHKKMADDEPVLFSTWGKKYAPSLKSYIAAMCTAQEFYNLKEGAYLKITFDDEKNTSKKLAVNETLINKLTKTGIEKIIGVQIQAKLPEIIFNEKADFYRKDTLQLLIDYNEYDKYFEITDVFT